MSMRGPIIKSWGVVVAAGIGCFVTSLSIIVIALTWIEPADRSEYFWQRIAWTVFLVALAWAYVGGFFSLLVRRHRSVKGWGAILPGLGVAIFLYVASSLLLMSLAAFWPRAHSWEVASQVYKTAGLVVVLIFLYFSWAAGVADTDPIPEGVPTPRSMTAMLSKADRSLAAHMRLGAGDGSGAVLEQLAGCLRNLREQIQYSIPHVGRIGAENSYFAFAQAIDSLSADCIQISNADFDSEQIQVQIRKVNDLMIEIQNIAQLLHSD